MTNTNRNIKTNAIPLTLIALLFLILTGCVKNSKATTVKYRRWSMIGCHIADTYSGIKVVSINKNSAAEKDGLKVKDIVLELNDKAEKDTVALIQIIRTKLPNTKIKLKINRRGEEKIIFLTTAAYPLKTQLKKMIMGAHLSEDYSRTLELIKEYEDKISKKNRSPIITNLKKRLLKTFKTT